MARTKQTAAKSTGGRPAKLPLGKKAAHGGKGGKTVPGQGGKTVPGQGKKAAPGPKLPSIKTRKPTGKRARIITGATKQDRSALREIKRYQKGFQLLIPKAPFRRLVREISHSIMIDCRWQASALEAVQEATEAFLTNELEMTNLLAIHARRVTIQARDMQLVRQLRAHMGLDPFNPGK